jgi:hypothetical protein
MWIIKRLLTTFFWIGFCVFLTISGVLHCMGGTFFTLIKECRDLFKEMEEMYIARVKQE